MIRPPGRRGAVLTPAQARAIYAYNERLFERYVRRIRHLPERAVHRREEIGHRTLFGTLVHILNVHEVWVGYIVQGRTSNPQLETLFSDPTRQPKDWAGFRSYDRRVWRTVRYIAADGLLQATFEQAHHLGEIIGVMWQHDLAPPEMTWIRVGPTIASGRTSARG
ncbi:MAG: hypothetical protein LVQ64_06735 [Thermoplasmatales archaeon]|nr:hypothetical protein [Thermoplasmatales archaeon]